MTGRQSKIVKHGLEQAALQLRKKGRTSKQIADTLTKKLAGADTLTARAVDRHFATLDAASVPEAHVPETAAANATLAVDVYARMNQLDGMLARWVDEADKAVSKVRGVVWDEHGQEVISERFAASDEFSGPVVDLYAIDWQARTAVARELRQTQETVVNLLERVHNAQQIETFQQEVVKVIAAADPETAKKLVAALQSRQTIQRAALLGAGS